MSHLAVTFGMHLDGAEWSLENASLGEVRLGPLGFLGLLETRLGTNVPAAHPVHRIDEYLRKMKRRGTPEDWFASSFAVDEWSTARQMLALRDELVEAGFEQGTTLAGSPRLEALSKLESAEPGDPPLIPGRADRIRTVHQHLMQGQNPGIDTVLLATPRELIPSRWQQILDLLQKTGTEISECREPVPTGNAGNLGLIQRAFLSGEKAGPLDGKDESLILLDGGTEWEAAEHLATWLGALPDENNKVAVVLGMDTAILDQALAARGLPGMGLSDLSRWREIYQVLPLAIANAWEPVDVARLAEFLTLSITPFPGWVCRLLLSALEQEPGTGGAAWQHALGEIRQRKQEELARAGRPDPGKEAEDFSLEVDSLLAAGRFDPKDGIPGDELSRRCQKVIDLMGWRLEKEPELKLAVAHAREIQKLAAGRGLIPRVELDRMLDMIIGTGTASDLAKQEAAPWHIARHPGELLDPWDTVIWWGFNDFPAGAPTFWSKAEREALSGQGIIPEESRIPRLREAHGQRLAFLAAKKHFIGISVNQKDGEEAWHHPFRDTILSLSEEGREAAENTLTRSAKDWGKEPLWRFAGREARLSPVEKKEPGRPASVLSASAGAIKAPGALSFTQMSVLIGCPTRWALQYHGGLRMPASRQIPTGNRMIGTFCHRIVEELYRDCKQVEKEEALLRADALYDSLLPSMASELLLPGKSIEARRYKAAILGAVGKLVAAINRLGLMVQGTETPLHGDLSEIPFKGFADMLLRDQEGNPYVLDLKWSYSDQKRRDEVGEGTSLQLAAYGWMLRQAEPGADVHAAYFMLAQGTLITDSQAMSSEPLPSPRSLPEIWELGERAAKEVMQDLAEGIVETRGLMEAETAAAENLNASKLHERMLAAADREGRLYQSPSCVFCDFGYLCGLKGGQA